MVIANMSILEYPKLLFHLLFAPKKETTLNFPEIGWTINIPKGFEVLTAEQIERAGNKARSAVEIMNGKKINYPGHYKFLAKYELENIFSCDFTDLRSLPETVWQQQINDMQGDIVSALHGMYKQYAHVKIAVENDARQKGNITFNMMEIIISTPQRELNRIRYFNTVYKDYGIHITMSFAEPAVGELMMNALRNSTFNA